MSKPRIHAALYAVESIREHGRVVIESICFTRRDARVRRRDLANEQTPHVRVVAFRRAEHMTARRPRGARRGA